MALILAAVVLVGCGRATFFDWSSLFRREVVEAPETTLAGRVSSSDSTERVAKARGVEGRIGTPPQSDQPEPDATPTDDPPDKSPTDRSAAMQRLLDAKRKKQQGGDA